SAESQLARSLVAMLDDQALDLLAERLASRMEPKCDRRPIAYTVATLAQEVGLSPRVIRAEIHTGKLRAVRHGRHYLIAASAVEAWASPTQASSAPANRRHPRTPRRSGVMASALASLGTVTPSMKSGPAARERSGPGNRKRGPDAK